VVTIYFGNNDSAWNGNIPDRYLLPWTEPSLHLWRAFDQATQRFRLVTRVGSEEYGRRLRGMIAQIRDAGADAIIVEPIVPNVWPPGLRATGLEPEVEDQLEKLKGVKVGTLLLRARELFEKGILAFRAGRNDEARRFLVEARESDYLVPRIKSGHASVLEAVAVSEGVPLVSVGAQVPFDDSSYFVDYCHPLEPGNRLIAKALTLAIHTRANHRPPS